MNTEQIKAMQRRIRMSYAPQNRKGCDDGNWGPLSIAACQAHLRALMPSPNPWPATDERSLTAFYGAPGDTSRMRVVKVPCDIKLKYIGKEIGKPGCEDDTIYCHEKVAASLIRILRAVAQVHPEILLQYYGVYDNRNMRNGSLPSLHARGAAIDLDAARNGNTTHWPSRATMPLEVMECFAREGWMPAGAFWHRDAMHFQATR
jgi:hypothetical protein